MNPKELREKTQAELADELVRLRREQFGLRMQKASGQLGQVPGCRLKSVWLEKK